MHIENISYDKMSLDRNGQSMLIQVYEKEIERLNNIINELEQRLEFDSKDEENHGYCEPYIDGYRDEATIILDYLK